VVAWYRATRIEGHAKRSPSITGCRNLASFSQPSSVRSRQWLIRARPTVLLPAPLHRPGRVFGSRIEAISHSFRTGRGSLLMSSIIRWEKGCRTA
jgi:hypothetical protein